MRVAVVAALSALMVSPSFAQTAAGEIDKANNRFEHALTTGDATMIARMYTENAIVMPPNAEMVEGREAILDYWRGSIAAGVKVLSLQPLKIDEYGGDAAREIGRFSVEVPDAQGRTGMLEGKYVTVWRKSGGDWRHDSDIWNFTQPPGSDSAAGASAAPAAPGTRSPSQSE